MNEITRRFALPYIMPAQAQKHVPHNQALNDLDILIHASAIDDTRCTSPPVRSKALAISSARMRWGIGLGAMAKLR